MFPVPTFTTLDDPSSLKISPQTTKKKVNSSYSRYGYNSHRLIHPLSVPFDPIISKNAVKLTHLGKGGIHNKDFATITSTASKEKPSEVNSEYYLVKQQMEELNAFDRIKRSSKKANRYPNTALDEALNYNKKF